ncbi:hypothetical protein PSE10B_41200 [Pseudomonas amygdali pv. eriobotryae]|nr:hypothetical protein PSE10B_41200 [Pseudomonas amygdali pv. eriobotryae]
MLHSRTYCFRSKRSLLGFLGLVMAAQITLAHAETWVITDRTGVGTDGCAQADPRIAADAG